MNVRVVCVRVDNGAVQVTMAVRHRVHLRVVRPMLVLMVFIVPMRVCMIPCVVGMPVPVHLRDMQPDAGAHEYCPYDHRGTRAFAKHG